MMGSWWEMVTDSRSCSSWKRRLAALVCILLLETWSGGVMLTQVSGQGSWALLVENAGISSMHTFITRFNTAIFLDRTDIGPSEINLPNGRCRNDPNDLISTHDCTAHSVEMTLSNNAIRPLFIQTDTWCSSGQFNADGTMVQTGGDFDGFNKIRYFTPCGDGSCDWVEDTNNFLQEGRWYATNVALPDGRQILFGGRAAPYVEFVPADGSKYSTLQLLVDTTDDEFDNLYPYCHLLPNGNIFVFAYNASILYDYNTGTTLSYFPELDGGPRNYPSAGSSVMLPLDASDGYSTAQVVVCGGATLGAYLNPDAQYPATDTCGRITATDASATWAMETMPSPRNMGDMVLLPDQTTLIVNGAQAGSQGWGEASNPAFNPWNYDPFADAGSRFTVWSPTTIARLYHSTANLLPDGRILIAGSNTHQYYTFTQPYPTELRVEAFSPPYLYSSKDYARPSITNSPGTLGYGEDFTVTVTIPFAPGNLNVILNNAPFSTHSYGLGQRQLVLPVSGLATNGKFYTISSKSPPSSVIAPPAYYMLFVVNDGIPCTAAWVQVG